MGLEQRPGIGNLQEKEVKKLNLEVFSCSLDNLKNRPNEDCLLVSQRFPIFAVADGVSRTRNPDGSYPDPSGAAEAAEIFCDESIDFLEYCFKYNFKSRVKNLLQSLLEDWSIFYFGPPEISDLFETAEIEKMTPEEKALRIAFINASEEIRTLNAEQGLDPFDPFPLDYLVKDYFCTCGTVVFVKGDVLHYGYIGDCGIRIYNCNDLLRLVPLNNTEALEEHRDGLVFESEREKMVFWRKDLRNRPEAGYLTYGVVTGEEEACLYCHCGEIKLNPGDLVFLHSDGFAHFITSPDFRSLFRRPDLKGEQLESAVKNFVAGEIAKHPGQETSEQFGDDKTLIAILVR